MWNNSTIDYYPALIENNKSRIICLSTCIFTVIIGFPFLWSIIWFEKYGVDKTRTIINMLVSRIALNLMNFLTLDQIPEIVRYIIGPLPDFVCLCQVIFRDSFTLIALPHIDAIVIIRYLFIFWLKNPTAFHHEFWLTLISIFE